MAGKSCLLFLTLVILTVCVSAHRPLVVKKNEATSPSISTNMEGNDEKIDDHVDTGEVNSAGHNDELVREIYPYPGPGVGREGGFQFQLGPIGFGVSWDWGYPFPVYGPPFLGPPYAWLYGRPGSYITPHPGQGLGYGPVPSSEGLNSPRIHN